MILGLLLAVLSGSLRFRKGAGAPVVAATRTAAEEGPALVVVLLVDGLSSAQLHQNRGQFGDGGFARLMKDGAGYSNAGCGHSTLVTGAGHATLLPGAMPATTLGRRVPRAWHSDVSGDLVVIQKTAGTCPTRTRRTRRCTARRGPAIRTCR